MEETRSKRVKEAVGSTFAGAAVGGIAGKVIGGGVGVVGTVVGATGFPLWMPLAAIGAGVALASYGAYRLFK